MARSLRRHKKPRPLIKKRKSKKVHAKTVLPNEITTQRPDIKKKLGIEPVWDKNDNIAQNYEQMGFASDLNLGTGRNRKSDAFATKAAQLADVDVTEQTLDEDLKVAMAQQRSTGKAAPKRPTPRQRQIVERLLAAHGSDIDAMFRDKRLNAMQHSKGVLQEMIEACDYWSGKTGVDFRVPNKGLW